MRSATDRDLRGIIAGLAADIRHAPVAASVQPSTRLEADLGLGSLERVELVHRLEGALSVRLEEEDALAASTVGERGSRARGAST